MARLLLASLVGSSLLVFGCSYDYAQLSGRDGGAERPATSGSGGALASGSGGAGPGSGGQIGGGSGGAGASGTGGSGATAGTGGATVGTGGSPNGTGGATGGSGGTGTGGAGGTATPRILSIDFIGGYTVTSSSGGNVGTGGQAGGAGAAGAAGQGGAAGAGASGGAAGNAGAAGGAATGGAGTGGATSSTTLVLLPQMAATEIAGVKPAARWNGAPGNTGTLAALTLADGTATTATVSWNVAKSGSSPGIWRIGYADAPGDVRMMNGYLDPLSPSTPGTVTVSGLPASITSGGYDVYVYVSGFVPSGTRTYRYAIGGATMTVSQASPSPTTFAGYMLAPEGGAGNYIVFRNLTGASFTLTATPGGGSPTRAPVNGIQIVWPAGS